MLSYSALPLNDDVLDRILKFCPTFGTLEATVLVSKAFYRVFQTHPKSITRAVAYNVVGQALPQALRVVRYPYYEFESTGADPVAMATTCSEDQDIDLITSEEKETLEVNAKMVADFEDIYSLQCKDRTSKKSVLTPAESWRFRRAMYRIMLYCNLFPDKRYYGDELYELDELLDDDIVSKVRRQRTAVLDQYSMDELHQLNSVVNFLRSVFENVATINWRGSLSPIRFLHLMHFPKGKSDVLLSLGLRVALTAYQDRDSLELEEEIELFSGYISVPLDSIWAARQITPPEVEEPASTWVLDQVRGADDTCSQCSDNGGMDLYTEANWSRFPDSLRSHLKSNLMLNPIIKTELRAAIDHIDNTDAAGPFIGELFSLPNGAPKVAGWAREDSYCFFCLKRFLKENLWRWFFAERVKAGWTVPEDCEYGWDCTMQHEHSHAEARNHLCDPRRGENA
ncbi:hypothetical protein B0H11DRAFT_2275414 [Mycena galericulata]|nr:hypothetical protein B0H11DRAFT_2275414 [Mycena galericulata]